MPSDTDSNSSNESPKRGRGRPKKDVLEDKKIINKRYYDKHREKIIAHQVELSRKKSKKQQLLNTIENLNKQLSTIRNGVNV